MINVIRMTTTHPDGDVAIDTLASLGDDLELREIYKYVKDYASHRATDILLNSQGKKMPLVEIDENEHGLPHASIYVNNVIVQQVFATKE